MAHDPVLQLGVIVVAGIAAQWLAWRIQLPAIVLLLVAGFAVGPLGGIVTPDALLGPSLPAVVSLGVGLVLFEGSLGLDLRQLKAARRVILLLVTVGVLVTWAAATGAASVVLDLRPGLALLVGAICVVTGPTVIGPLLAHIRPTGAVGPVLRGEGILGDAIGAMLAVLVFEAVLAQEGPGAATGTVVRGVLVTIGAGTALGLLAAGLLVVLLRRFLVPDFLQSAVTIGVVLGAFTIANEIQEEAGLLTVTVTGIALATQRWVSIRQIVEFSESVGILVVSGLFIVLSARLGTSDLEGIGVRALLFLAVLIVAIRPLAVGLASLGSKLARRERLFVATVAPRGIVAAATASIFGLRLTEAGDTEAQRVTSVIFVVVVGTILVYGFGAPWVARRLALAERSPQGVLIVGAHPWARRVARTLADAGFRVVLADTQWSQVSAARLDGFTTYFGSVLSGRVFEELDLAGIGRLLALTANDELNALAAQRFAPLFGSEHVYQLPPSRATGGRDELPEHLSGRLLFSADATYSELSERFSAGTTMKSTQITEQFEMSDFWGRYGDDALPMFLVNGDRLSVVPAGGKPEVRPGQRVVALVAEPRED
ncbi:MAG: cation:proton antiporter [Acidimicrobiia bacterium]